MPSSQPAAGHLAVVPEYLSSQSSPAAKKSEPNRSRSYDPKKPHIADTKMTSANWYKHVHWLNSFLIIGVPIIGLVVAVWTPLYWQTALFAVVYYYATVCPIAFRPEPSNADKRSGPWNNGRIP